MTPEGWILNVGAIIGSIAAAYNAWQSKRQATKAKELSEPTGNGFALTVCSALKRVESKLDGHIRDHATHVFEQHEHDRKKGNDLSI